MGNLENKLAERASGNKPAGQSYSFKQLMNAPAVKGRFDEVMKDNAPQFMASLLNLYNMDQNLQKCDPNSVIGAAMVAASLDLPIDKNLGYAWIIPYGQRAQFQIGYKGYVQLALRTGQYKSINVVELHEGELVKWDKLTEEMTIDFDKRKSDAVIGYAAFFELLNGFRKAVYWKTAEVEAHAKKFSKTYNRSDSIWKKDFSSMAKKTVLTNMLTKWGIMSVKMQEAFIKESEMEQENGAAFDGIDITPESYQVDGEAPDTPEEPEDKDQAVLDI